MPRHTLDIAEDAKLAEAVKIVLRRLEAFSPLERKTILSAFGRLLDRLEEADDDA